MSNIIATIVIYFLLRNKFNQDLPGLLDQSWPVRAVNRWLSRFSIDDVCEHFSQFLNELKKVICKLLLILVSITSGFIPYEPNVVLDFGHQTTTECWVRSTEMLQHTVYAIQVGYNFIIQKE